MLRSLCKSRPLWQLSPPLGEDWGHGGEHELYRDTFLGGVLCPSDHGVCCRRGGPSRRGGRLAPPAPSTPCPPRDVGKAEVHSRAWPCGGWRGRRSFEMPAGLVQQGGESAQRLTPCEGSVWGGPHPGETWETPPKAKGHPVPTTMGQRAGRQLGLPTAPPPVGEEQAGPAAEPR